MRYTIVVGSSTDMNELQDNSVHLIVTSPPYYNAKEYSTNIKDDIGNQESYSDYLEMMHKVFSECKRVLCDGRYMAINIADTVIDGYKYAIPADYMFMLIRNLKLTYIDDIIWSKPEGVQSMKRFGVFIENPYPLYYYPNNTYEHIIIVRKGDTSINKELVLEDKVSKSLVPYIKSDIWSMQPQTLDVSHIAPFPEELPRRIIMLYSYKGEVVLDPFAGSGTTGKVARGLRRSCVLYEINPSFIDNIKDRVGFNQSSLSGDEFNVIEKFKRVNSNIVTCTCGEVGQSNIIGGQEIFKCSKCGRTKISSIKF